MKEEKKTTMEHGVLRTKMKKIFQSKLFDSFGIKLISLMVAIVIWMVIINIDDPYREKTFTVNVETINEDALESVNKVFEVIEGGTAQVRVKGKKSIIDKLKTTDIRATADLSNLSAVNAVAIVPELTKTVSSEPTLECKQVLKVALEDMARKQVKVNVVTEGTPEEGYYVQECTAKPNMIEVTGGESAISKIDNVQVVLNIDGISQNFSKKIVPEACDEDGNIVESNTLSFGLSRIRVTASVLQTKYVDVKVKITGTPASGYEFVEAKCLPEKIEVAGTAKMLENLTPVVIPINIEGMRSSSSEVEQNISIQDYVDDGIIVLSDYALVSLQITVEKLEEKTIEIPANSIKFASLDDKFVAEPVDNSATVELLVRGRSSVINALPSTAFTAFVDCTGLRVGRHSLPVEFDLGDTCELIRSDNLQVRISRKKSSDSGEQDDVQDEPSASPDVTETPLPTESPEATEETSEEEDV